MRRSKKSYIAMLLLTVITAYLIFRLFASIMTVDMKLLRNVTFCDALHEAKQTK